jgi:hypothetical protein
MVKRNDKKYKKKKYTNLYSTYYLSLRCWRMAETTAWERERITHC